MLDLKPSGSPAPPGWMTFYCTNAKSKSFPGFCQLMKSACILFMKYIAQIRDIERQRVSILMFI